MKIHFYIVCLFLLMGKSVFSQQVSINNSIGLQDIIENNLINGCVEISNINSPYNGSVIGLSSYGYFEQNNSGFPFENGLVLTTGNVNSIGSPEIETNLDEGNPSWGTDPDLSAVTGTNNTLNATTIEFDFESITNTLEFNYILASEEYGTPFPCTHADGFAFLIKEIGGSYKNIAVLPNGTAVNTSTVQGGYPGQCPPSNIDYFDGLNLGDTNFNGRTKVLTATASIKPNTKYHIKLIIADQGDSFYDSAVFIQGNSFNASVNLGEDFTTCIPKTLDADIGNPNASYTWYKDGIIISGANSPKLAVNATGTYKVEIDINLNGLSCPIEDEIKIQFNDAIFIDSDLDFTRCDNDGNGSEIFDLSNYNQDVIDQIETAIQDSGYNISFHNSQQDAESNSNPITTSVTVNSGNTKPIFTRISGKEFDCIAYVKFDLVVNTKPNINTDIEAFRCEDDVTFSLNSLDDQFISGDSNLKVTYHYTREQAELGIRPITDSYRNTNPEDTLYVRVEDENTGCISLTTLKISEIPSPDFNTTNNSVVAGCEITTGNVNFDLTESLDDILNGLNPNDFDISYYYTEAGAQTQDPNDEITDPTNYLTSDPEIIFIRIIPKNGSCPSIVLVDVYPNILLTLESELTDYANCGGSTFDLFIIANDIVKGIEDIKITFYEDAARTIEIIKTDNYTIPNNATRQTIYLSLSLDNCPTPAEGKFDIYEADAMDYYVPENLQHCSNSPTIDLNEISDLIDYNANGYDIQFYLNETDRDLNTNKLQPYFDYDKSLNEIQLWARITQNIKDNITNEGVCFDDIDFNIEINTLPTVDLTSNNFQYCVPGTTQLITLDMVMDELKSISSPADVIIMLYLNQADAIEGNSNFIANPESFETSSATLFSRVSNADNSSCALIDQINVEIYKQPEFSDQDTFFECGLNTFLIADISPTKLLTNFSSEIDIKFYDSEQAYINGEAPYSRTKKIDVSSGPVTIFCLATNVNNRACEISKTITLSTDSYPEYSEPTDFYVCLEVNNIDVILDLNEKIDEISSGHSRPLDITFYETVQNAEMRINQLPLLYSNSKDLFELHARIENEGNTDCYEIVSFGVYSALMPNISKATPVTACATDYSGDNVVFDLTATSFEIYDVRPDDLIVKYFESLSDIPEPHILRAPDSITTDIDNPEAYLKISNTQTEVYLVVINTATGCFEAEPIELISIPPPPTKDLSEFQFCEDGSGTIDLSSINNRLVYNLEDVTITYFSNNTDPSDNINPVDSFYNYIANGVSLFARIQSIETGCYFIKALTLFPYSTPYGPDLTVTANATSFLSNNTVSVSVTGGSGDYVYSIDNGTPQASNQFENVALGQHSITVKDIAGCAEGEVLVQVIDIPKYFTPNHDGFHDTWHIIGIENLPGTMVYIYDRFGKILTTLESDAPGWDGLYRGRPMPTDDYWYVADIVQNGEEFQVKGHFSLKR
ncbi:choice-of-anchor L domain-containing protein [Formosa sp. S-31]|uniref:choice-of-anchor L domain-containing protein n=1 Tax=Formosa sp. S-31 TaxID=2790949 RepID=UPI003EBF3DD5